VDCKGADAALNFISLPGDEGVIPPSANLQLLAGIEDIEKNVHHWVIVDCRDKESYNEGHIPSAIHLGETCNDFFRGDLEVKGQGVFKHLGMRRWMSLKRNSALPDQHGEDRRLLMTAKWEILQPGRATASWQDMPLCRFGSWNISGIRMSVSLDGGIMRWSAAGKTLETKENRLCVVLSSRQMC